MGVYDILNVPGCEGAQVKCWYSDMRTLRVGDKVPSFSLSDYAIALREGGYLIVTDKQIDRWQEERPDDLDVYDKYGAQFDEETWRGTLGEGYFFKETGGKE